MKTILITGGAGFIGSNFVRHLYQKYPDYRLIVLDALTYAGNIQNLPVNINEGPNDRLIFWYGNVGNGELVDTLVSQSNVVIHFAAESHVDRSISGPAAFIETNIIGTHNLLSAARAVWLDSDDAPSSHRFHHVSTDEVYGSLGPDDPGFSETTPYAPNSPYSASKAASDHLVRAYHHTYGLDVSTSNCSNNYGPYQFPEKLIPLMIVNALEGKALPVYGDGSNIRDWLYVEDHVRGIELVMTKGRSGETYNIGGNEERANIDIVRTVCREIDEAFASDPELARRFPNAPAVGGQPSESLITYVKDRPGHDWRYAIDANRVESELGYSPQHDFATGIRATVDWMLDNEAWWRAVMDGSYRDWVKAHYDAD